MGEYMERDHPQSLIVHLLRLKVPPYMAWDCRISMFDIGVLMSLARYARIQGMHDACDIFLLVIHMYMIKVRRCTCCRFSVFESYIDCVDFSSAAGGRMQDFWQENETLFTLKRTIIDMRAPNPANTNSSAHWLMGI